MKPPPADRFATRTVIGVDEQGADERVVYWLDLRPGALWTVGRVVNPQLRENGEPRPEDVIFESYELDDALEHLNEALEDEVTVLEHDHIDADVRAVTRLEIEPKLAHWLLHHGEKS